MIDQAYDLGSGDVDNVSGQVSHSKTKGHTAGIGG